VVEKIAVAQDGEFALVADEMVDALCGGSVVSFMVARGL
jgi:hypothetical protein